MIEEGSRLVRAALASRRVRAVHAAGRDRARCTPKRRTPAATDWTEIVGLYDVLLRMDDSPVVELNRAVAVAMRDGPEAGLAAIDAILERGDLKDYRLAHAARAEFCRRLGRTADARPPTAAGAGPDQQEPERRFLERRIAEIGP